MTGAEKDVSACLIVEVAGGGAGPQGRASAGRS
eukprot:CAMPEP_0174242934 /NCGR_PEP_ID=MMETSP0417-20130205/29716_1 /TAXON_ID=242541 /ORGANISM="Mayorella sp, Strain BSH-02190019" /LENGTH=32 /DNA_ID= /DNA_START= /DNA_END= /DNA_ORIENTATION=